jgi:D-serine deaminase-like pyridoxal phosphate-dependent protein
MKFRDEIPTPALLLDLDAFESNIAVMTGYLRARGRGFRPHGKTHKCPAIARILIDAGAIGICAARLSEAEVFADHQIPGLLVTTAVIEKRKIARALDLAARATDTIFCVDHERNVRDLNDAAAARGVTLRLAVDLYFGRTGISPGEPTLELVRLIHSLPHVAFAGLQSYDGQAAHTAPFDAREARTTSSMSQAVDTRRLIERDGIPCPMVTGGSTGTYRIDSLIDGVTELQPGSFVFMDMEYRRIGGPQGSDYNDFQHALTVVSTVVSRPKDFAVVDAGYKAFSTDRPFTPEPVDLEGVTYGWAGDEHGRLYFSTGAHDLEVGDRVEFIPPHCDPTVNLYDCIYALRGDRIENIWAIEARGKSQ